MSKFKKMTKQEWLDHLRNMADLDEMECDILDGMTDFSEDALRPLELCEIENVGLSRKDVDQEWHDDLWGVRENA